MITAKKLDIGDLAGELRALPLKIAKQALVKGVSRGARTIRDAAKRKVMRSTKPHLIKGKTFKVWVTPGNLARGIRFIKIRRTPGGAGDVRYAIVVRREAYYWWWIELGKRGYAPHPFLKPAFDANIDAAMQGIATESRKFIESYFRNKGRAALGLK